jgi:hypothetical protein
VAFLSALKSGASALGSLPLALFNFSLALMSRSTALKNYSVRLFHSGQVYGFPVSSFFLAVVLPVTLPR